MDYFKKVNLISPYGGKLIDLEVKSEQRLLLLEKAKKLSTIKITQRSLFDMELLATGGFSPLDRFMNEDDYLGVVEDMRLSNGIFFPIPITLPVNINNKNLLDKEVALLNQRNEIVAIMRVENIYRWNLKREVLKVYSDESSSHPLIAEMQSWGKYNISGKLKVLKLPKYNNFEEYRFTPKILRSILEKKGYDNIVSFQTRNPMHRVHEDITKKAINKVNGLLLLQPSIGMTSPHDIDQYTRIRCYKKLIEKYFDKRRVILHLVPIAMRLAGPKSVLWHAIIRRNYGANHFIVGRDAASPGKNKFGNPFYEPDEVRHLAEKYQDEIGVKYIFFNELIYLPDEDRYEEVDKISAGQKTLYLSGTRIRESIIKKGETLPEWILRPEIASILRDTFPPINKRGFCVWFTGLPCSGKSTTGELLVDKLIEYNRRVTLLDGDVIRNLLSYDLGFSKKDRETNLLRIAYVASEVVKHNGVAVACTISPYELVRNKVRNMVGNDRFILVYLNTPLRVCEKRDVKGMYAKAKKGEIKHFTGVSDIYEKPKNADITLSSKTYSAEKNTNEIIHYLIKKELIRK